MAQQPPGEGRKPIVDPLFVKKRLAQDEVPPEDKDLNEADKESRTTSEDFESFGDPSELKDMKED